MNWMLYAIVMAATTCAHATAGDDKPATPKNPTSTAASDPKGGKGDTPVIDHLPIKQAKGNDEHRVAPGHWIYITAQISQVGGAARIDGDLNAQNYTTFDGYHGAGTVTLYCHRDNIIAKMVIPVEVGVNGTALGGSHATRAFSIDLTPEVAQKVRRFEVKGYQANHPNFIAEVKKVAEEAKKVMGGSKGEENKK